MSKEIIGPWVKSTFSAMGNCVELAKCGDGSVALRNSRDPHGPVLNFTPEEIAALIKGVEAGEFDSFAR